MPRPTAAQFAYGSATVVFSTIAMLLLSGTATGIGVAVIALAALALGLLVSLTVPTAKAARTVRDANDAAASGTPTEAARPEPAGSDARVPGPRSVSARSSRAHSAVGGHSLRG
ncbi:hypothetical protein GCM10009730_39000 [Streptomyces albidochromogenes]|uniref:hypothetical protein n=1 Tax=Streptomyces albidochromogenes TaxID=329524 RepID=UPI00110FAF9E|nr:hypothetical protein [Streptomyces albidochromogenes]